MSGTLTMIDFVRPRVVEVFTFEKESGAPRLGRQALGKENGTRTTDKVSVELLQFRLKGFCRAQFLVGIVDSVHYLYQVGWQDLIRLP